MRRWLSPSGLLSPHIIILQICHMKNLWMELLCMVETIFFFFFRFVLHKCKNKFVLFHFAVVLDPTAKCAACRSVLASISEITLKHWKRWMQCFDWHTFPIYLQIWKEYHRTKDCVFATLQVCWLGCHFCLSCWFVFTIQHQYYFWKCFCPGLSCRMLCTF